MKRLLTHEQTVVIARANALAPTARDVLSPFERELVAEIRDRFIAEGRSAVVTDEEMIVLRGAVEAMSASLRGGGSSQRRAA